MKLDFIRRSTLFAFLLTLLFSQLLAADTKSEFSEANNLLFFTDHLSGIGNSATLNYQFTKSGTKEAGFEDTINLKLSKGAEDKGHHVDFVYFSNERKRDFPALDNASGNPLVMLFLQRDVNGMSAITGGLPRYFQKRIKIALEDSYSIRKTPINIDGKKIEATEITITPFIGDSNAERFKEYINKTYTFTLTDEVPGGVFQIKAVVPGIKPDTPPLHEERVAFKRKL